MKMVKAGGTAEDGRRFVILGLSRENCKHLLKGKPIKIDVEKDLGIPGAPMVLLLGGETEDIIAKQLRGMLRS
jgi:hypothetical protein